MVTEEDILQKLLDQAEAEYNQYILTQNSTQYNTQFDNTPTSEGRGVTNTEPREQRGLGESSGNPVTGTYGPRGIDIRSSDSTSAYRQYQNGDRLYSNGVLVKSTGEAVDTKKLTANTGLSLTNGLGGTNEANSNNLIYLGAGVLAIFLIILLLSGKKHGNRNKN